MKVNATIRRAPHIAPKESHSSVQDRVHKKPLPSQKPLWEKSDGARKAILHYCARLRGSSTRSTYAQAFLPGTTVELEACVCLGSRQNAGKCRLRFEGLTARLTVVRRLLRQVERSFDGIRQCNTNTLQARPPWIDG